MTIEEMNDVIQDYCGVCEDCLISTICDACGGDFVNYPYSCSEAYKIITTSKKNNDMVNHPPHYCREGGMESIDEMILAFGKEAVKNFCLLNVWKYRYRAADKNGIEDLKKSDWYMNKYKELCNE